MRSPVKICHNQPIDGAVMGIRFFLEPHRALCVAFESELRVWCAFSRGDRMGKQSSRRPTAVDLPRLPSCDSRLRVKSKTILFAQFGGSRGVRVSYTNSLTRVRVALN